jgi:molybdopterin/thiamine biosynthesis adenylyltransferase
MGVSVNFADWPGVPVEMFARSVDLGACQMAGAGAVGSAIALALKYLPVTGQLIVIDPKSVNEGILNRCLCFDSDDIGEPKATTLANWIAKHCPGIDARPFRGTLQQHRIQTPGEIDRLIVGVDSRRARRGLQEELAREVFDASTTGVEETVFHHNRLATGKACLACVYAQTKQEGVFERHVAEALGVTLEDVQSYLITPSAAARIALVYPRLGVEQLIGRAYDSVFREMCATQSLRTSEERQVLAPFAFVSQLAGTVAAIELFLRCADEGRGAKFNYWRVSPWRGVNIDLQQDLTARSDCAVCASPQYQALARRLCISSGAAPMVASGDGGGEVHRGVFQAGIQEQGVSS